MSTSPELRQQHPAWRAAVLACATPNAYATSSGLVAVTSGMCALCPSDDALAFVLGHEVAHERLGHSRACEAGLLLAWLAAGEVGGEWPSPVMPTEWEAEADLAALDFVRAAGYEPALALAEILARVPVSPERRDALANLARGGGHGPARDQRADQ